MTLASRTEPTPALPEGLNPSDNAALSASFVPAVWADDTFFDALAIPIWAAACVRRIRPERPRWPSHESLAEAFWPGQDPIARIRVHDTRWLEVVGVASIRNYEGIVQIPPPNLIFFPAAQNPRQPFMMLFYSQPATEPRWRHPSARWFASWI